MTTALFSVDSDAPVRDKLLAKAKEFIVENGIQNLSHERLAKACGISKGACLHYFPSKAALWDKLIEDSASNLPRVAERLKRASNNMFDLYSMELLHNTQAIDLRKMKQDNVKLSDKTGALYKAYRKVVPFVEKDRIFSGDLENGIKILKNWEVK